MSSEFDRQAIATAPEAAPSTDGAAPQSTPQSIHERLRNRILGDNSGNGVNPGLPQRGADGKFIRQEEPADQQVPDTEGTENVQQTDEETQPESTETVVESEPVVEAPRKLKVKIDGEELEVPEDEVRLGYMRQADYTKKTQEVARERQELPRKVAAETDKVRNDFANQLRLLNQVVMETVAPELLNVNMEELWSTNPAKAGALQARGQKVTATLQRLQAAMAAEQQNAQAQQQALLADAVAKAHENLSSIDGWGDDKYSTMLKFATKKYGFSGEELGTVVDPRVIRMALDAQAYHDGLTKAAEAKTKTPVKSPVAPAAPAVRPGVRGAAPNALSQAREAHQKSGSLESAASYFKTRLAAKPRR